VELKGKEGVREIWNWDWDSESEWGAFLGGGADRTVLKSSLGGWNLAALGKEGPKEA
jgi:hypothetical protein